MCIAVVGGLKRLERTYEAEARRLGVEVRVLNAPRRNFTPRLQGVDAMVVFADRVSHNAKNGAVRVARDRGIPVRFSRSCGVCTFRKCVRCFLEERPRPGSEPEAPRPPEGSM